MIKHIVLFSLKAAHGLTKVQAANKIKNHLDALPNQIPQIKKFETGIDIIKSERSFDLALVSEFESLADLEIYQKHEAHCKVVEIIALYKMSAVAVDYQF